MAPTPEPGAAWPAPAKINLFLHIVGRRPDGYHLLQTAFQFIDLCDRLWFEPRRDGVLRRLDALPGVAENDDLVLRAARRLQAHAPAGAGADIRLEKHIPIGGGLGGGSSDAATTLWGLNCLWGLGLGADRLATIGLGLGADVPVFVRGFAAWAEGVGERLTAIEPEAPWYLVVAPAVAVRTADIFADPELTRHCKPLTICGFLSGRHAVNVCEPVVRRRSPEVAEALDWLGPSGRMSGTGSSVFAPFATEARARERLSRLPPQWRGFVCRGLNRSPLMEKVDVHCAGRGRA